MTKRLLALAVGAVISGLASVGYTTGAAAEEKYPGYPGPSYSYGKYEEKNGYRKCEYKSDEGYKFETYYGSLQKYYKFTKLSCVFDLRYPLHEKDHGFPCSYKIKKGYYKFYDTTYQSLWYTDPYKKKGYLLCIFKDYEEREFKS